jgi:hypothetical protein
MKPLRIVFALLFASCSNLQPNDASNLSLGVAMLLLTVAVALLICRTK